MAPRKRPRPNPAETSSSSEPAAEPSSDTTNNTTSQLAAVSTPNLATPQMPSFKSASSGEQAPTNTSNEKQVRRARSWYGSWPKPPKASAVTSVARENIFGGTVKTNKTPDLSKFEHKKSDDTASVRGFPEPMAGLSGIPENPPTPPVPAPAPAPALPTEASSHSVEDTKPDVEMSTEETTDSTAPAPATKTELPATPQRPSTSSGWLGWWARTPFTESQAIVGPTDQSSPHNPPVSTEPNQPNAPTDRDMPAPDTSAADPAPSTPSQAIPDRTVPPKATPTQPKTLRHTASTSSWFGLWNSTATPESKTIPEEPTEPTEPQTTEAQPTEPVDNPPTGNSAAASHEPAPKAGTTWAFWSKDSPKGKLTKQESGEIAVMGEGSEAHPKPMTEDDVSQTPTKGSKTEAKDIQPAGKSTWRRNNKRGRPPSMDIESPVASPSKNSTLQPAPRTPTSINEATKPLPATTKGESPKSVTEMTAAALPPNLLLPSFESTYQLKENPSILKQITQLLLRTSQPPTNHVFRVKDPPKIRKAIAIGVHGLFPAAILRPMIGQPTGTSLRFASLCADAIRRWADDHGCSDCEIEKVALEGEGKINERVENLWKLMLNWIEHLRNADLIIMASHSQGVPVSIMLLEKLIDLGIITDAKIGVCAMAGVALGPFPDYKSSILLGSAAELWEFGDPQSANSQRFEASLKRVLDYGARVTFIGSIDDQLVPMESAVYSPASHPYIYRAAFIDGRVHAPDFIAHLVGFALKLRNLGVSDHGLIRELSQPLAGSLYSGEGHSRLYYDPAVYNLAVSHALETTAVAPSTSVTIEKRAALGAPNPYVLPWIMRGLLEEDFVKTELSSETEELLRQFDDWKPSTKALKDVKYRLEAVRSRL